MFGKKRHRRKARKKCVRTKKIVFVDKWDLINEKKNGVLCDLTKKKKKMKHVLIKQ